MRGKVIHYLPAHCVGITVVEVAVTCKPGDWYVLQNGGGSMLLALHIMMALCTFTREVIHFRYTMTFITTWSSDTWVRTVVYIHTP